MAGLFPGGFPPQSPVGMSDVQRQEYENRQAAMQRVSQQLFQQSCTFKTAMAGAGGFVIGGGLGMFLSGMRYDAPGAFAMPGMGGTEAFNNLKWHRQLYEGLKDMGQQGLRTGKNFGRLGAMFTATDCVLESYRAKSDIVNPVLSGCLLGGWLARKQGIVPIVGGCAGFAAFSYAVEWYMHRETQDDE